MPGLDLEDGDDDLLALQVVGSCLLVATRPPLQCFAESHSGSVSTA